MRGAWLVLVLAAAGPAAAAPEVATVRYGCERGVEVPVAYVNATEGSVAVLSVEGRQIALVGEPAASGARYGWPSGGSGYVWLTKGEGAALFWKDGAAGSETALLSECRALP